MQANEVQALIQAQIPDAEVQAQFDGSHLMLVVVSESFEGLNPLKKQQKVYACLNERIASGDIHAVHMKTYTPEQWQSVST